MTQEAKTMILKINKRISVYREGYGRTVAEKIQQEKKKRNSKSPDTPLRVFHFHLLKFRQSYTDNKVVSHFSRSQDIK